MSASREAEALTSLSAALALVRPRAAAVVAVGAIAVEVVAFEVPVKTPAIAISATIDFVVVTKASIRYYSQYRALGTVSNAL